MPDTLTLVSFLFLLAAGAAIAFRFLSVRAENSAPRRVYRTPAFIHLVTPKSMPWRDAQGVEAVQAEIVAQDFTRLGEYQIVEMPDVNLAAFFSARHTALAVLYEHPAAGIWVDVCAEYENGESLTVTNAPAGGELDQMPGHDRVYDRGASVAELVAKLLELRRPEPCRTVTAESFPRMFQDRYAEEMKWRALRGGATAEEIRRVAAASGAELTEDGVDSVRASLQAQAILPCQKDGECPYDMDGDSAQAIEQMPVVEDDPRTCPTHGRICPGFVEELAQPGGSAKAAPRSAS